MLGEIEAYRQTLLGWYNQARRDLPWRRTSDPYAILVSELMLQQTQVKTVIPYYHRFLERFPTVVHLGEAPEQELLKQWQGLGYYRRARNLQAAARQIVNQFAGVFPRDKQHIDSLRGVGPYTSAAVASIAFNQPWACVDGNVIRVVSRLFAIDGDVAKSPTQKKIKAHADDLICEDQPGDFNQAMMELGATVCTPRSPSCLTCPVGAFCQTRAAGDDPTLRPVKTKRVQPSRMSFQSLFLFSDACFLLCRRPDQGLMAGMWELPSQAEPEVTAWPELFDEPLEHQGMLAKPLLHRFTHLHATYQVDVFKTRAKPQWLKPPKAYAQSGWFTEADLQHIPLTKVFSKLRPQLMGFTPGSITVPSLTINTARRIDYHLKNVANPKELVILLHGYQQRGETILGFTESCFADDQAVIAPDAPFPVPYKARDRFRLGYAWYFFDIQTGEYKVDMTYAVDVLSALVDAVEWSDLPKRVIGYSQGGYLAPFLGLKLQDVIQVIGVNSRFRSETLGLLPFPIDAVHGSEDKMVDAGNSHRCHQELMNQGNLGYFHRVPETGHQIDRHICNGLKHVIKLRTR